MGGEEQASGPILGREGYLERLTRATFKVRVEEGQVQLLVPDFAYFGFLRPETARIKLYSQGEEVILTLEAKGIFSAGILNLSAEAAKTNGNGSAGMELGPDSTVYFRYSNHPEAKITLERVKIGKNADSEYTLKEVFNNNTELKRYCSARVPAEEDLSVLLERAEKAYARLEENSKEEDSPKEKNRSKTVLAELKPANGKSAFTALTAIQNWFQACLDENESGELLTHEEEVELAKQRDRANYLRHYAFAAVQTVMAAYFPEAVSPLFAEAYSILEAIVSSDKNGFKNLFPQCFSTKRSKTNIKQGYLSYAQEVSLPLNEILTLTEEIPEINVGLSGDSLGVEFPEEFFPALSWGFAEPDSIPPLRLKGGEAGLQSKLTRYQQLLIQIPFQDKVWEQILAGALSRGLEFMENEAEQKTGGLSLQEKNYFSLILNCSRAYQRGTDLYDQTIDQFMAKNYKLCFDIARRMSARRGEDKLQLFDYFQEGVGGLKIAAEYFQWERGHKFSTYATWWIRHKIVRGYEDTARTVRLPVHVQDSVNHLIKVTYDLRSQLHREPTSEEISAATSVPEKKVIYLLNMQKDTLSLENYVGQEDNGADSMLKSFQSTDSEQLGGFVHRPISPLKLAIQSELAEIMDSALSQLTPIEELIIRMRYGLDPFKREYTLEDVGRELGRTRERVRQIEAEGNDKLKRMDQLRSCR